MTIIPRMMKRQTAAAYCDMSVAAFEREINAGRLPGPVMLGGREHWCRNALMQSGNHLPLRIIFSKETACYVSLEAEYHSRFAAHRIRGEWFNPHSEILDEIERLKKDTPHD